MDNRKMLISKIFTQLESDDVVAAAINCLRLARSIRDYLNAAIFLREMYPARKDFIRALLEDTEQLNEDAQKFLDQTSLNRWLDTRQLKFSLSTDEDGDEKNVLTVSILEIDHEIEQWNKSADELIVPQGMTPYDTAAFTHSFLSSKAEFRLRIKALHTIRQRVKVRCLNYVTMIERQLNRQKKATKFLDQCQTEVNNYFMERSESVYEKMQKACQLVDSNTPEDHSLLLTQVRRVMKAVVDHFFPPPQTSSGGSVNLNDDHYLNRMEEFIKQAFCKSTSMELLQSELSYLTKFFRKLNAVASKGVHAAVSPIEAKQGLVGLYMFLYNVVSRLREKTE